MAKSQSLPSERLLNAIEQPLCPACRSRMTVVDVTPDLKGYAVGTFECPECPRLLKKVVQLDDPMKSAATVGWLHGQLVGPT
jgi:hypothetical protein